MFKQIPANKAGNACCAEEKEMREAVTLKPGAIVFCSRCGRRMNKDGFTAYEKKIVSLGSLEERLAFSGHRRFALQRLVCSNRDCPGKTKSGSNETHALLPSFCVPKSPFAACVLEDAQETLSFFESKLGPALSKKLFRANRKQIAELEHSERFLITMRHRYRGDYRNNFINGLVLSKSGMRLCRSIALLKDMAPAFGRCAEANGAAPDGSRGSEIPRSLPEVLMTACSRSVNTLSALHKISLPYVTDRICLQVREEPARPP